METKGMTARGYNGKRKRKSRRAPLAAFDNDPANVVRVPPSTKRQRVAACSNKPSSAVGHVTHALQTIQGWKSLSEYVS